MTGPQQFPDQMVSRPQVTPGAAPRSVTDIPGAVNAAPPRPAFVITVPDASGQELVSFREENGRLVVEGDESRWDEGAKRFLYGLMQWSGQVGIRWKDEAAKAAEQA